LVQRISPPGVLRAVSIACKKHKHRTSGDAWRQARQLRTVGREGQQRLRVYECPNCGYWHVTSDSDWAQRKDLPEGR
jgi:hypothetical protein